MFKAFLTRFIKDERGVTAIEYGVIGVALAVGLALIFGDAQGGHGFMQVLLDAFNNIADGMGAKDIAVEAAPST